LQQFTNPRMALSAHLTAVQSGMALMILGILWSNIRLKAAHENIARLANIMGFYSLWLGLVLSAASGASPNLPIAGAGHQGSAAAEISVSILVIGGSIFISVGWILFVAGLIRSKDCAQNS